MPSTLKPINMCVGTPGVDYEIRYYKPVAAQTYKAGDWLKFSGSGTVQIAAAAGNAVGAADLVGMSLHDAAAVLAITNTAYQRGGVLFPKNSCNFVLPLGGNSAASAPSTGTVALTDLDAPTEFDLVRATTGIWMVSTAETSNAKFRLMGLWGADERDNAYGTTPYAGAAGYPHVLLKPILASFHGSGA